MSVKDDGGVKALRTGRIIYCMPTHLMVSTSSFLIITKLIKSFVKKLPWSLPKKIVFGINERIFTV